MARLASQGPRSVVSLTYPQSGFSLTGRKLQASKRAFDCPKCGLSIDRDLNVARNILHLATTAGLAGSYAGNIRPLESAFEPSRVVEPYTAKPLLEA